MTRRKYSEPMLKVYAMGCSKVPRYALDDAGARLDGGLTPVSGDTLLD